MSWKVWSLCGLAALLAACSGGEGEQGAPGAAPSSDAGGAEDASVAPEDVGAAPGDAEGEDTAASPDADSAPDADAADPLARDVGDDAGEEPRSGECADWVATRRPLFGDLHVHTSWSFDAYGIGNTAVDPAGAYRFAKGEPVPLAPFDENGMSTRGNAQLERRLDFTAVTDHSEFLGEVSLCLDPDSRAYNSTGCRNFRTSNQFEQFAGADFSFGTWGLGLLTQTRPDFCDRVGVDCEGAGADVWSTLQAINNAANDPCTFTALHGYEYTGQAATGMNHRNVIFRSDALPERPVTAFEAANWEELARGLNLTCREGRQGCEFLTIPHNPNLSGGLLFMPTDGDGEPLTAESARLRASVEPLVEIMQVKSESECRNGFPGAMGIEDEFCDFEKTNDNAPLCQPGQRACGLNEDPATDDCVACEAVCDLGESGACIAPQDYVRNVLKLGLERYEALGVNPYMLGFIGSTDTHNGTPGKTVESTYVGNHGRQDDEPEDRLVSGNAGAGFNPGGLAVVWAEENTRGSIFDALRRRETYATSGTRPLLRFFAGAELPEDICGRQDFAAAGYASGVPMGSEVTGPGPLRFAVWAMQDAESAPLQRIQIVKVWVDAAGNPQERVIDITPEPRDYTATVDTATCAISGPGRAELCAVWTDTEVPSDRPAAWYVRLLENPTCRWMQWDCVREQVNCADTPLDRCCDPAIPKIHQERAWSSPIFYQPPR